MIWLLNVMKNPVSNIVVKKQYSIAEISFFSNFLLCLLIIRLEKFGSKGKIKEFDKIPSGACTKKFPYANPDAAP